MGNPLSRRGFLSAAAAWTLTSTTAATTSSDPKSPAAKPGEFLEPAPRGEGKAGGVVEGVKLSRAKMASDFGSNANIYRTDGAEPQEADEQRVVAAALALQRAERDRISPFANLEMVVGYSQDENYVEGISLRLTSYFLEDEDNAAEQDAIIARDEIVACQFAEALQQALSEEYRVEYYSGSW